MTNSASLWGLAPSTKARPLPSDLGCEMCSCTGFTSWYLSRPPRHAEAYFADMGGRDSNDTFGIQVSTLCVPGIRDTQCGTMPFLFGDVRESFCRRSVAVCTPVFRVQALLPKGRAASLHQPSHPHAAPAQKSEMRAMHSRGEATVDVCLSSVQRLRGWSFDVELLFIVLTHTLNGLVL